MVPRCATYRHASPATARSSTRPYCDTVAPPPITAKGDRGLYVLGEELSTGHRIGPRSEGRSRPRTGCRQQPACGCEPWSTASRLTKVSGGSPLTTPDKLGPGSGRTVRHRLAEAGSARQASCPLTCLTVSVSISHHRPARPRSHLLSAGSRVQVPRRARSSSARRSGDVGIEFKSPLGHAGPGNRPGGVDASGSWDGSKP
jgi:hypothetical protein